MYVRNLGTYVGDRNIVEYDKTGQVRINKQSEVKFSEGLETYIATIFLRLIWPLHIATIT